jgi:ADP-ribosylglycohydrolase
MPGALLGLAIGDALGTTNEFKQLTAPAFPELATGPLVTIVGGGPFKLKPGQVTDDTEMAVALHTSLHTIGHFDVGDVASRYVEWTTQAFDTGVQTASALALIADGTVPLAAGHAVWIAKHKQPAGNGSLMRTAPIGVFFANDVMARRTASLQESAITHYDPRCRLACAALNAAIAASNESATAVGLIHAARDELVHATMMLLAETGSDEPSVVNARVALESDLDAASDADPQLYGPELHLLKQQGFVRVAFRLAFWELVHAPSFRQALVDVANRGGDADTNAAITGALLGAYYGAASIPPEWVELVLGAGPKSRYHPTAFARKV